MSRKAGRLIVINLCLFFVAGQLMAAEFSVVPFITVTEEYNDNVFLDPSDKEESFITRAIPGVETIYRTERADLRLSGRLQQSWYSRLSYLDALDQYYTGSLSYALTPLFSVSGRAGYAVDSQPDRDVLETGLILTDNKRQRVNYGVSGAYTINERTSASLSYDYSKSTYLDSQSRYQGSGDSLNDTESNGVSLGLSRNLGMVGPGPLTGRLNVSYSHDIDADSTVDSYRATAGLSSDLSEKWNVSINAGVRRSDTDYTAAEFGPLGLVQRDKTERSWGGVVMSSLSYRASNGTVTLSANHDLVPAGGTTGVTERTGVALSLVYRFTYELSGTFATSYIRNKASRGDFGSSGTDTNTYYFTPGLRYAFNKDLTLDASYNYLREKDKLAHTTAERNLFLIQLRVQHPLFN